MDFDDILPDVGEYGKYQQLMVWLVLLPGMIPCGFHAYNQLFMATVPPHHCRHPPGVQVFNARCVVFSFLFFIFLQHARRSEASRTLFAASRHSARVPCTPSTHRPAIPAIPSWPASSDGSSIRKTPASPPSSKRSGKDDVIKRTSCPPSPQKKKTKKHT